jgi:hypothetical protein
MWDGLLFDGLLALLCWVAGGENFDGLLALLCWVAGGENPDLGGLPPNPPTEGRDAPPQTPHRKFSFFLLWLWMEKSFFLWYDRVSMQLSLIGLDDGVLSIDNVNIIFWWAASQGGHCPQHMLEAF